MEQKRIFDGKIKDFKSKTEKNYEKARLKAYLNSKKEFTFHGNTYLLK